MLTISADKPEKTEALSHAVHSPFSMLSDPGLGIIRAWGTREAGKHLSAPCMFLVGPQGRVQWRYLGKNMSDRPDLDQISRVIDRLPSSPPS